MDSQVEATIAEALRDDGLLVVLTGAGISAESGVPTFRGPEGYWTVGSRNYQPQELATAAAFARMPDEIWRWYLYRRSVCRAAAPNAGHRALVELDEALGDRFVLITQNVDGLHLRAGSPIEHTLQIHGNIDFLRCARACSSELTPIPDAITPKTKDDPLPAHELALLRCPKCGGRGRPHVLWFDEYYDEELFKAESAMAAAADAALLVVVGTAGATNLPQQIARRVARSGRPIIDINIDDNPFAELAESTGGHALRSSACASLPELAAAIIASC
ncbi:MAG TPA: Sir2 family NAD-dependent protein deacetylase [Nannocystaceae bacterium]|nr:Sir2 family NAD-dependent protein deacetylase [Nannocystaceae bacterium]